MKLFEFFDTANVQHESSIKKKFTKKGFTIWKEPAGADSDFPDIGIATTIDGVDVNINVEVKKSKATTMGSIRNWVFKDGRFSIESSNPNGDLIIEMLNNIPQAKKKAALILKNLKLYFDKKVTELSQACLTVVKDVNERNKKLHNFAENYKDSYYIISKRSPDFGNMIIDHYKHKMVKRKGKNLLMFVLGDEMFLVKTPGMPSKKILDKLFAQLGVDDIPFLPDDFNAEIECRISPNFLETRNRVRIDPILRLRTNEIAKLSGAVLK